MAVKLPQKADKNSTFCILIKCTKINRSNNFTSNMLKIQGSSWISGIFCMVGILFLTQLGKQSSKTKIYEEIQNWLGALHFKPALRSKGQVLQLAGESMGNRK